MRFNRRTNGLLILLFVAPLFAGAALYAQGRGMGMGGRRGPMSVDDRMKQMTKDLNLTTDQQAKIKPILEDEQKQMMDMRNNSTGDRQAMRQKMIQMRDNTRNQVRAQLTDKQKETFDKMEQQRQQRMQDMRNRRGGMMGGPGGGNQAPPPQN
jgi:periplasmic protein CpxP/Spy